MGASWHGTGGRRRPGSTVAVVGLRFFRRVRLGKGLTLNFSKSGPSVSVGVRGAHMTFGPRGVRRTVGVPGTGLFYTSHSGRHTGAHTGATFAAAKRATKQERLLAQLDDLHRAGVLTDTEYAEKRAALEATPR
jgi:uncharacterized protein DUF4236